MFNALWRADADWNTCLRFKASHYIQSSLLRILALLHCMHVLIMHAQCPLVVVRDAAGGNSFNQLAVLATYSEAHLQAVCHYFRSLAVAHPFQVARENLLLLFDQARAKYESLPASQAAGTPPVKGRGRGGKAAAQKPRVPIAQLLPVMAIRFAHAHGMPTCARFQAS